VDESPEISRRRLLKGTATVGAGIAIGRILRGTRILGTRRQGQPGAPNVIVIVADDMRWDEAPYLPSLQRLLVAKGTTFTAARHNISECSPARAGFLTGQYSKRHKIRSQDDAFGTYNDTHNTVAVWMQAAGYYTGVIGKYFTAVEGRTSPPGWNVRRQLADNNQQEYGYRVWDGKKLRASNLDKTRYLEREVVAFLRSATEPFFLWFTPTAGHGPFKEPPSHKHDYAKVSWPDLRDTDVSGKPPWIQSLPPLADRVLASIRRTERVRLRVLLGLDDTVAAIVETLRSSGQLPNTVIIFTSDNGILWGEHRVPPGSKNLPYDPAVLVPCIVRGPSFPHMTIRQPAHMSIDLTATCVDLAGATPGRSLDGVSLAKVVANPSGYDDRQLLYDRDNRDGFTFTPAGALPVPPADGIFTQNRKLTRYKDAPAAYELYDLDTDPNELRNVADDPRYASDRSELEAALDRLLES
jgi:arylsulfatase A-like enzyme